VACRTAVAVGAAAVLCLAFPLQPPTRRSGTVPPSRLPELEGAGVPVLVVQGETDRFGMVPDGVAGVTVVRVRGDHGLKQDTAAVAQAVLAWLPTVVGGAAAA
jgi:predicted alpha/beta-hydrolase family hydrolase